MTHVLIIGGGGMIGRKIATRLTREGLNGAVPEQITLYDLGFGPEKIAGTTETAGNLTDPGVAEVLVRLRPDVIIHLAAIVSGEAEADFDLGWQVNLFSLWHLLEALRAEHDASGGAYCPRLIFASSVAAFGPPFPNGIVDDRQICEPRSSYGTQKAMGELMVNDFSRKGFVDGLSLRLPTISVRPGKPNAALSSCFSAIIREPLNGVETLLPVSTDVRHIHASPRSAARFFTHAATLDTDLLDGRRSLNLPSVSCTVEEQIEALRAFAGEDAVRLIRLVPDEAVNKVVSTWPTRFETPRARELGFTVEDTFEQILQVYVEDDLPAAQ